MELEERFFSLRKLMPAQYLRGKDLFNREAGQAVFDNFSESLLPQSWDLRINGDNSRGADLPEEIGIQDLDLRMHELGSIPIQRDLSRNHECGPFFESRLHLGIKMKPLERDSTGLITQDHLEESAAVSKENKTGSDDLSHNSPLARLKTPNRIQTSAIDITVREEPEEILGSLDPFFV